MEFTYKQILIFLHVVSAITMSGAAVLTLLGFSVSLSYVFSVSALFILISIFSGLERMGQQERSYLNLLFMAVGLLIITIISMASGTVVAPALIILNLAFAAGSLASASLSYR